MISVIWIYEIEFLGTFCACCSVYSDECSCVFPCNLGNRKANEQTLTNLCWTLGLRSEAFSYVSLTSIFILHFVALLLCYTTGMQIKLWAWNRVSDRSSEIYSPCSVCIMILFYKIWDMKLISPQILKLFYGPWS